MPVCIKERLYFSSLNRRNIEMDFSGGHVSSDGGVLLLREVDRHIGLTDRISKFLPDLRDQSKVIHSLKSMLQQRVYGIACGYDDGNDHDTLRHDIAFQTATNRTSTLASPPTLHRFEMLADRNFAISAHKAMVESFITSFDTPPKELVLDFDATDDLVHGNQEGKFYHGYYGNHCFLPLYVFCGKDLLVSYLRPSNIDGAKHSWSILSLLVKRFRQVWPNVRIIFRGDGGFCRHKMLNWCERNDVGYIVGMASNKRLEAPLKPIINVARAAYENSGQKQRIFMPLSYQAGSWKCSRKVVAKAEYTSKGPNLRFIVTNLEGNSQHLYDKIYCARGDMENRIKEQQLDLFADRTSCHSWWSNQMRLILSSLAYILLQRLRDTALKDTQLAKATAGTIRNKLLKIGVVITRNTRRIRLKMASGYPLKQIFKIVVKQLARE